MVAIVQSDRVLCPDTGRSCLYRGRLGNICQGLIVAIRYPLPLGDFFFEYDQLLQQDCRLHSVTTAIHANSYVFVFILALAVNTQAF